MSIKIILYLGTDPTDWKWQRDVQSHVIHYPVINIVPRRIDNPKIQHAYSTLEHYSHFIFTSKNTVRVFCQHLAQLQKPLTVLAAKAIIAIGQVTATHLLEQGLSPHLIAKEETQEGIVKMLSSMDLQEAYFFMPRSALARSVLVDFFDKQAIRYQVCDLYDTVTNHKEPRPDLSLVDEIIFTSPSTVRGFIEIFGYIPSEKKLTAIGPVTEEVLKQATQKEAHT